MSKIIVFGRASQKEILNLELDTVNDVADLNTNLMDFLRERGVNIASSCYGEGVCKKCELYVDNKLSLSCQKFMRHLQESKTNVKIEVNYL